MAIPFVTIELDKPYKVRFGMGAQIQYEQLSGKTIPELGIEMQTGMSVTSLNHVLYVMLENQIEGLTLTKVAELVDDYADLNKITDDIVKAINAAYPEAQDPNEIPPKS